MARGYRVRGVKRAAEATAAEAAVIGWWSLVVAVDSDAPNLCQVGVPDNSQSNNLKMRNETLSLQISWA